MVGREDARECRRSAELGFSARGVAPIMFGGKKRKALNAVVPVIQNMIQPYERLRGGLPEGFWFDPYVLGFLTIYIGQLARVATDNKIDNETIVDVIFGVFLLFAPKHTEKIMEEVLSLQKRRDPDYALGATNANKCVSGVMTDHEYDVATQLGRQLGSSNPNADAGGYLVQTLFYEMVEKRLG